MVTIYPDVSEFQPLIDSSYDCDFFMFRVSNEFGRIDFKAQENLKRSLALRTKGKLKNFGGYVNPGHVSNTIHLINLDSIGFPKDAVIMQDLESWPQSDGTRLNTGNKSPMVKDLATRIKTRQNNRADISWLYANKGDLESLNPDRIDWLGLIVAAYQSTQPTVPGMIGWQYTNGVENYTKWRSSTPPFGHCDHNALFIPIPLPGGNSDMTWTDAESTEALASIRMLTRAFGIAPATPGGADFYPQGELAKRLRSIDGNTASLSIPTADQIATAVVAKLPTTSGGGISKNDVIAAVKEVLSGTSLTPPA